MVSLFGRGFESLQLHTKGGVSLLRRLFLLYSISVIFPELAYLVRKSLFCPDFMCFMVMNHVHETNINVLVTNSGALIDYSFYLCTRYRSFTA